MKKVYIHPTAIVNKTAKIGEDTKVWHCARATYPNPEAKFQIKKEILEKI